MMYNNGGGICVTNSFVKPGQVHALQVNTADGACGLCCYPLNGVSSSISIQYALSPEAAQCISLEEVNSFVREVNDILQRTHLPMFPLIFMHFIIPFSPICFLSCATSSRQKKLQELIERTNETLKSRNCHWELGAQQQAFVGGGRGYRGSTVMMMGPLVVLIRHDLMSVTGQVPMNMAPPMPVMPPSTNPYGVPAQAQQAPYSQSAALYQQMHQAPVATYPAGQVQMTQPTYPGGYAVVSMNNNPSAL